MMCMFRCWLLLLLDQMIMVFIYSSIITFSSFLLFYLLFSLLYYCYEVGYPGFWQKIYKNTKKINCGCTYLLLLIFISFFIIIINCLWVYYYLKLVFGVQLVIFYAVFSSYSSFLKLYISTMEYQYH